MIREDETGNSRSIFDAASAWHVETSRDDMDWEGFMTWLAADPRHRSAYDQIALADSLVEEHRDNLHEHDVRQAGRWRRPLKWSAGLTAAAAASLIAFFAPHFLSAPMATYQTFGSTEQVALEDGSTVLLAPRSRLVVTGGRDEKIELAGGAWFNIRHNAARALAITAGQVEITDIGTRFDVQATDGQVRVAVAEGEVQVSSSSLAQPVHLHSGDALLFDGEGGRAAVSKLPTDAVGQWRQGRITYEETPLSLVIADLARYSGIQVEIGRALRGRLFSGTLVVSNGKAALRDLSQLMGLELHHDRSGYRLDERER
ncbi:MULTISPECIES: FecR domain-containing protein [unclassified Sphingomonas]|uniref:FecR family protein n=1 Tax=unclassified Sphingomonas TaxID=196159 RepID=UPI00092C3F4B|nr:MULTISPECIES: FecR domain-containing protein [unclassified Sphingomonas]MBN8847165.1 FecR domain-containing protein [Sphingomonas sp.]OJV32618.1 MAG: hypothetical protein BGO24_02435 [Sphingomonas sp. 67-36]